MKDIDLEEIEKRFGILPNFFRTDADEITNALLWQTVKNNYLDLPMPSLLKEYIFVYLSRFCEAKYCLARHTAFLCGKGSIAGDPSVKPVPMEEVQRLLHLPLAGSESIDKYLVSFKNNNYTDWPEPGTIECEDLLVVLGAFFAFPGYSKYFLSLLKSKIPKDKCDRLFILVACIKTAIFWTVTHPEIELEADLLQLMKDNEELMMAVEAEYQPKRNVSFPEK